ncbi:MAG: trypsin-like peptidase domain-containing protein [Candidatus Eisenbacteria bacterium]
MTRRVANDRGTLARAILLLVFSFGVGAAVVFLLVQRGTRVAGGPEEPALAEAVPAAVVEEANRSIHEDRRNAIVVAAERVSPAVVTVSVRKHTIVRQSPFFTHQNDFFDQFLRDFFPYREYSRPVASMGSGVIFDGRGYLFTNSHVVAGADRIEVVLGDGRTFEGSLVGTDPSYDLALIRIEGSDLPVAPLGDSDDLKIGEWAIAIGNPFGYLLNNTQPSVTAGVISAVHRDVRTGESGGGIYKDMIQTDAAINPGNSGGPLVNGAGEVIGINTFIFTSGGGSLGMGFAIPINTAKGIVDELILYGEVRNVWVGVRVQEMTRRAARMLGLRSLEGVLVTYVDEGSPAEEAGMEVWDVIIGVNGEPVGGVVEARRALFGVRVGDRLRLEVLRKGDRLDLELLMKEVVSRRRGGAQ